MLFQDCISGHNEKNNLMLSNESDEIAWKLKGKFRPSYEIYISQTCRDEQNIHNSLSN